jgi:hypothetical protein
VDDVLRQVFDAGEPVVVRMRHEPHAAAQRLLVSLGAGWIVDPVAPPCVRQCGQEECRVSARTNERVSAVPLSMASLGSGGQQTWEANWIDFRSSVANVERRRDRGDVPATCDACGCEVDITPAPHSPKCPTLHRDGWTREGMLQAVETWAAGHDDQPPVASDWTQETSSHPSARQAVIEFGSWGGFLEEAGFTPNTPRRRGRRLGPPAIADGRELLDRMDAGEPLNDDTGLEEAAAVGETAVSGAAAAIGEPERAAASSSPEPEPELEEASEPNGAGSGVSSSPEPGAVEAAQTPADDGAVDGLDPAAKRRGRNGRWTREAIVAAIRAEAERTGFVPQQRDWGGPSTDEHPNCLHAQRVFGNWGNAIEAAGYPRPRRGQKRVALNDSEREPQAAITSRARGDFGLGATVAGASSRSEHDHGARVKVNGTGLTYRDVDEALAAADEIEADGERVADQARFDGNGEKADQAAEISRELAERIRAAAEKRAPNIHETIPDRHASRMQKQPPEPLPEPDADAKPHAKSMQERNDRLLVTPDEMPQFQRALARALIAGMRAAADALEQELA